MTNQVNVVADAFQNFTRLGFRLKVYAVVLPLCVALAVALDVGLHWPLPTIAAVGTVVSFSLLLLVPVAYTVRARTQVQKSDHAFDRNR